MLSLKFLNAISVIPHISHIQSSTFFTSSQQQSSNRYTSSVSPFEKSASTGPNDADLSSSSPNPLLSNFATFTKSDTTQKTSGSDVAKLLSDFLVPSEELYRIHIHASYNNTIVSLTNSRKDVLINSSGGLVGFKKAQRGGYEAAHQAAVALVEKVKEKGIKVKNVEVLIKGFGPGRDAAFKAIASPENPWIVKRITDSTPLPFGGCRPRKARRL
ncbi:2783_t:CDS:2 [Racocetra fulgida]|uniref:2783_t:CDS:1 n=1 Tax=Racocetra fulgida TaxID=60492 RepID=A0A9N9I450_9GLOM|nr:2783_t:CDS:2 [Racocetra fulgida]